MNSVIASGSVPEIAGERKLSPMLISIISVFIFSRIFWYYAGVRFHAIPLLWFHQFIDPYLMKNSLFQSCIYLHTQPPLFNLIIGSIVKTASRHAAWLIPFVYHLLGLIFSITIWKGLVNFNVPKRAAFILALLFILSPASILYENWLLYTQLIAVLLAVALVALQEFVKQRSYFCCSVFFWSLAACVLIRTTFHLIWLLGILLVLVRLMRSDLKVILRSAAIPLLIVCGYYAWSFYLYGSMPSSTWMGMSVYKVAAYGFTEEEKHTWINEGKLSDASRMPPYSWLSSYAPHLKRSPVTEIPVLDQKIKSTGFNNYHNLAYHGIAKLYLKDALTMLRERPDSYLEGIKTALRIYFQSSSTFSFLEPNKSKMKWLNRLYDSILFGQFDSRRDVFWFLIIGIFVLTIYGCAKSYRSIKGSHFQTAVPVLFITANIFYFTIVTCAFEVGENQRYRFEIDSYFLFLAGLLISDLMLRLRPQNSRNITL